MRCPAVMVLALGGCNQIFDIDPTGVRPDEIVIDDDQDGIDDRVDLCPGVYDPAQFDDDRDAIGDACDNCPVVANTDQASTLDGDNVGDVCDPHPATDGDCLRLFDGFHDPAAFSAEWTITAPAGKSLAVTMSEGTVTLTPSDMTSTFLMLSMELGAQTFDGQLRANVVMPEHESELDVVTDASGNDRAGCSLRYIVGRLQSFCDVYSPTLQLGAGNYLSSAPASSLAVLRLDAPRAADTNELCRVDYGVAAGGCALQPQASQLPTTGHPGVRLIGTPATLDAVAFYEFLPGAACPAEVRR